jgi:chromosomal replication initiator protein
MRIKTIQEMVADFYEISIEEMKLKTRQRSICEPRQVSIYLSLKYSRGATLNMVGRMHNLKDHSSVRSAKKKIERILAYKIRKSIITPLELWDIESIIKEKIEDEQSTVHI